MGIDSYASVFSFIYVEDHEVRIEILMPLLTVETWLDVERADRDFLEVSEQDMARAKLEAFFCSHNKVEIDGREVTPVVQRLDFYGVDFKDFAMRSEPRRLSAWTARVGAILSYGTRSTPGQVDISWDLFNSNVVACRSAVFAFGENVRHRFTAYKPDFTWKNPGTPPLPPITPVIQREGEQQSPKDAVAVLETLLWNMYRAFDYRDEERTYDALARSIHGDLLERVYLEVRRALTMQEQGGAVSRVKEVKLVSSEPLAPAPSSPSRPALATTWQVTGTVEHWGHIHTRINEYEAVFRLQPIDGAWKVIGMDVSRQERVGYRVTVRRF
jgi:hypothetical protein